MKMTISSSAHVRNVSHLHCCQPNREPLSQRYIHQGRKPTSSRSKQRMQNTDLSSRNSIPHTRCASYHTLYCVNKIMPVPRPPQSSFPSTSIHTHPFHHKRTCTRRRSAIPFIHPSHPPELSQRALCFFARFHYDKKRTRKGKREKGEKGGCQKIHITFEKQKNKKSPWDFLVSVPGARRNLSPASLLWS